MSSAVLKAIAEHAQRRPCSLAIVGGAVSITFGELVPEIDKLAHQLAGLCSGKGPIAVCLDNSPAWALVDLALLKIERASVPLPAFFTPEQRDHAIAQSGSRHLIIEEPASGKTELRVAGQNLRVMARDCDAVPLPGGTAKVTYTSGSTGSPKGVCLSQAMMEETAQSIVWAVGRKHAGIHCALLPLGVLLENVAGLYAVLLAGGTYAVPRLDEVGFEKPFAPDFMRMSAALSDLNATSTILVPELLRGLVAILAMRKCILPPLSFVAVGGAKLSPQLLVQAAGLGIPVFEGYGLSEAGSVVSLNTPGSNRPGTAGRFLPHVKGQIAPDGELTIGHPIFLGYAGGEPAPDELHTGDIVSRDDDGFITVRGRKSALVITGFGRNIAPEWVESELLAQPVIRQALVFGDGADSLSSLIVPASAAVTRQQIDAAVGATNDALPAYAAVKSWTLAQPFTPMNGQLTANGRLKREAIHQAYARQINSENTELR
jgi:long-subunit acyl-CoA synthetase (AMP-forming)